MTTTMIDQLIQDQQQATARAQQELQQRLQQQRQQAGQDLTQALADIGLQDFWATIADVGYETRIETAGAGRNKRISELIIQVPLSEDLQLAGFQIKYSLPRGTISFTDGQAFWHQRDPNFTVSLKATELPDTQQPLGAFLQDRRQAYLQYRERQAKEAEEEREEHVRTLRYDLKYYRVETPAEAQQIFDELVELEPDNADDWHELLVGWRGRHDYELQQAAEEKQREVQAEAYETAYRKYHTIVQAIRARNHTRLEALQAELDQPFTVWQLEYGIVAHESLPRAAILSPSKGCRGDDGQSYADTASVYALEEPPAKPGMCRVFAGNVTGVVEKYIYHPVAWRELTTRPTDEKACRVLTHPEPYFRLVFHPETDAAEVEAMIAERLEPEPDPPKAGRLLSEHDRRRIQEPAKQDPDYVPF